MPVVHATLIRIAPLVAAAVACGGTDPEPEPEEDRPPPSAGHAMVYHDGLSAVLMVNTGLGASTSPPSSTHTILWRWTGTSWESLDANGPPIRNLGGVAYDSDRDVLVLFGGTYDIALSYDETWEWRAATGCGLGRRDHTEMAYDPETRKVVLFGGQIGIDSFPSDTWLWDGNTWERIEAPGPPGRVHHAMALDPVSRKVILFGGYAPDESRDLGDTWTWSGSTWEQGAPVIATRTHARMVGTDDAVLLIGGATDGGAPTRVSRRTGGAWVEEVATAPPLPRALTAVAYNPVTRSVLLFGGARFDSGTLLADTWELLNGSWQRRDP